MKYIKFEERQWNKRGRICYANPYQIEDIHWPASPDGKPVMISIHGDWKTVLDEKSLALLASSLDDELMTDERKKTLLHDAVLCAHAYRAKESNAEKIADEEEQKA